MGILDACELSCFSPEVARVFENAIERLFYLDHFRVGGAILPQKRVRARLKLLDGMILRDAERKLRANLDREVRNSTAYTMATIFNCIAESESDLIVDPELNRMNVPSGRWWQCFCPTSRNTSWTPCGSWAVSGKISSTPWCGANSSVLALRSGRST